MGTPYVGEIRLFAGNFAPAGWEFCSGQLLPISENETLFNLIGTTYGGDGQETFALPDMRGRVPVHQGTGPGGVSYSMAQSGGVESVILGTPQMPSHSHVLLATKALATDATPVGLVPAASASATVSPYGTDAPFATLAPQSVTPAGGSQPHENMQPYLCVNYIISMFGIFPSPT